MPGNGEFSLDLGLPRGHILMPAMWLAFLTWLSGVRRTGFNFSCTKIIILKNEINPGTFACEVSTKRIPVGI